MAVNMKVSPPMCTRMEDFGYVKMAFPLKDISSALKYGSVSMGLPLKEECRVRDVGFLSLSALKFGSVNMGLVGLAPFPLKTIFANEESRVHDMGSLSVSSLKFGSVDMGLVGLEPFPLKSIFADEESRAHDMGSLSVSSLKFGSVDMGLVGLEPFTLKTIFADEESQVHDMGSLSVSSLKFGSVNMGLVGLAPFPVKAIFAGQVHDKGSLRWAVMYKVSVSALGSTNGSVTFSDGDDLYKVVLKDDPFHSEYLVEKALLEIFPLMTHSKARGLFHEARDKGEALVIITSKEEAIFYQNTMVSKGLNSDYQPIN